MRLRRYLKPLIRTVSILTAVAIFVLLTAVLFCSIKTLKYKNIVESISNEYDVDCNLVKAIIYIESGYNESAVSNKGAVGLMQVLPSTAEFICGESIDLFDPQLNVYAGVKYLKYLLVKFDNLNVALAAYNAGEGNVSRWLNDKSLSRDGVTLDSIPFRETRKYVKKVVAVKKALSFL